MPTTPNRTSPQDPPPALPTDEELAATENPAEVLRGLIKLRGTHRDAVLRHALESRYMTEELAWRLPVQLLERHPRFGPLLAARIVEICGDSPSRWQKFATSRPGLWNTQLLGTTLLGRLREA